MNKNRNEIVRSMAMVTQLGLSMLAPVILCAFIGNWLDERYGWSTSVVLLILGVMAGARNTWILLKQTADPGQKRKKNGEKEK